MINHGEWDKAEAREIGERHPERCWILTDRDAWHLNPYFKGEIERHPEDSDYDDDELLITKEMDDGSVRICSVEMSERDLREKIEGAWEEANQMRIATGIRG